MKLGYLATTLIISILGTSLTDGAVALAVSYPLPIRLEGTQTLRDVPKPQAAASQLLAVKEEIVGEQSPKAHSVMPWIDSPLNDYKVSPDGMRVAWPDLQENGWIAKVNGVPDGPPYDEVRDFLFSPDSRHFAYWARRAKIWKVVIDRKERGEYSNFGFFLFSPDSAHYAYHARQGRKSRIISDSIDGPPFDEVGSQAFSPTGQQLVYPARSGRSWIIVDDGKTVARSDNRLAIYGFTPREENLIFTEDKDRSMIKMRIVIGTKRGPWFDAISSPLTFSRLDEHFAYAGANIDSKRLFSSNDDQAHSRVLVDGRPGQAYSSDMFQILSNDRFPTLLDWGIEGGVKHFSARRYGVSTPVISPDGQHTAYAARMGVRGFGSCLAQARNCNRYAVILDGKEENSFDAIPCAPAFDPEGGLYYGGFREGAFFLTAKTDRLEKFALAGKRQYYEYACNLAFHPGGHFTVELSWPEADGSGRRGIIFVDGRPTPEQTVGTQLNIQFLGEDFHTVYEVEWRGKIAKGSQPHCSYVVLDGQEGKSYDQILGMQAHFTGAGEATYVARKGRTLLRVTQSWNSTHE